MFRETVGAVAQRAQNTAFAHEFLTRRVCVFAVSGYVFPVADSSSDTTTAVHFQADPGEEFSLVGYQEGRRSGDVFRRAEAAQRDGRTE